MSTSIPESESLSRARAVVLNIAAYKFVELDELQERRAHLKALTDRLKLRGTILLSPEGINLFMAGDVSAVREFLDELRVDPKFADLNTKESFSDTCPFRRMLVRLKKEIISFGIESVQPLKRTSPKLPPQELKRWLDEGRTVRLLDTRNRYEVELGTFVGAEHLSIGHFREFPLAIEDLPESAKAEPLVMFCTGGIRCEKAGPLMEQVGFEHVYQLDGGILKYFEECGGAHYDGSCFVFDGRVALDPELKPTGNILCFACQAVLSHEDIASEHFLFGSYCPRCYVSPDEQRQREFEKRQLQICKHAKSQPGCTPYDNLRRLHVARRFAGLTMLDYLVQYQPSINRQQWREWLDAGQIRHADVHSQPPNSGDNAHAAVDASKLATGSSIVKEGQCFEQHMPNTIEPEINPDIQLLHEDESIVVVNKPAPLPTHASGRYNKNSLLSLVGSCYPNEKLRVAHRLDANTTGIVLFCRKHQSARFVQPQFGTDFRRNPLQLAAEVAAGVDKLYIARVIGHPEWETHQCDAPISAQPVHRLGVRAVVPDGQAARTEFRVRHRCSDGTSVVEVRPITGRTNQIRIHLWHLGMPVVGDPLYLLHGQFGERATLHVADPPMCLHALRIRFTHPDSRQPIEFETQLPQWAD